MNDIANILDVILRKEEEETSEETTEESTEDFFVTASDESGVQQNQLNTVPPSPIEIDPEPKTETEPAVTIATEAVTTTEKIIVTEPPPPAPVQNPQETEKSETIEAAFIASSDRTIDVLTVFPDIPEKLKNVPFPESLHMIDSLKKNIRNLANFSSKDFGGMEFYIATTDATLFTPRLGYGMLSDARRYRTNLVDAECKAVIMSIEKPKETIFGDIKKDLNAGVYVGDIICVPFNIQSELVRNGLLMNLNKIPFLNLNAEYYNASATESLTVNGNIYGLVSDLTFNPSNIYAVFYNRALINKYNISNPLELYKNGGWTYDGMLGVAKELTAAINNLNDDTRWSIGLDKENGDIINGLFISSGNKYFTKKDYDFPVLNFNNERTLKLLDVLAKIFAPKEESGIDNYLVDGEWNQNKAFTNGNVLFTIAKLDIIPNISDINFNWGILPTPSLNSEDKIYSFTDGGAMCVSIPKGARNSEACGVVTNALSIASYRQLQDIYVSEQMLYRLRDVDSVKILGDIINNTAFNQYNAFSTIPEIYGATVGILKESAKQKDSFPGLYEEKKNILNEFFKNTKIFDRW